MFTKILITLLCLGASHLEAADYIVKLKHKLKYYDLNHLESSSNYLFRVTDTINNLRLIKVSTENSSQMLKNYFDAEYVVENVMLHALLDPADPRRKEQWALDMIHAAEAWDISIGSSSVVVAVIDTGLDLKHEDLKNNLWINPKETPNNNTDDDNNGFIDDINGWDFNANDADPSDETGAKNPGHGTHCAGIIGASCGNDLGVCGISPKVSLMALRFLNKEGSGDLFASTKAIDYAASNGAQIISASWGASISQSSAQPIIDAIKRAEENGVIFVAAAANDGKSNDTSSVYPANAQTPNMISVAASNSSDEKPSWSNYGCKVDLAAPGADILSTIPGGYSKLSGTSMATPLVSGLVALMKSVDKNLNGAQARSILQSTGQAVNIDTASNRRIDAQKALAAVVNQNLTLVPAALTLKPNEQFNFSAWGGVPPYRFQSLNQDIATIDQAGHLVALKTGDVSIEVSDADNHTARSISIKITEPAKQNTDCPLDNEIICQILCGINPELPWCSF